MTLGSARPELDSVVSTARLNRAVERLEEGSVSVEELLEVFDELSHSGITGRQLPELLALKRQQVTLEHAVFTPSVAEFLVRLSRRLPHLSDGLSSQVMVLLEASSQNPAFFGVVRAITDERLLDLGHPLSTELRQAFRRIADRSLTLDTPASTAPSSNRTPFRSQPIMAVSDTDPLAHTNTPLTPSKNLAIEAEPTPSLSAAENDSSTLEPLSSRGEPPGSPPSFEAPSSEPVRAEPEAARAPSSSTAPLLSRELMAGTVSRAALENLPASPATAALRGGFAAALLVAVIGGVLWMLWSEELLRALGIAETPPEAAPSAAAGPSDLPTAVLPSSKPSEQAPFSPHPSQSPRSPDSKDARPTAPPAVMSAVPAPSTKGTSTVDTKPATALAATLPSPHPEVPVSGANTSLAATLPSPPSLPQPAVHQSSPREAPIAESSRSSATTPRSSASNEKNGSPREQPVIVPKSSPSPSPPPVARSEAKLSTAEQLLEDVRGMRDDPSLIQRKAREVSRWIARSKLEAVDSLLARLTPEHLLMGLPAEQPVHPITRLVGIALENVAVDSDDTRAVRALMLLGRWAQHPEVGRTARAILESLRRSLIIRGRPTRQAALDEAVGPSG